MLLWLRCRRRMRLAGVFLRFRAGDVFRVRQRQQIAAFRRVRKKRRAQYRLMTGILANNGDGLNAVTVAGGTHRAVAQKNLYPLAGHVGREHLRQRSQSHSGFMAQQ